MLQFDEITVERETIWQEIIVAIGKAMFQYILLNLNNIFKLVEAEWLTPSSSSRKSQSSFPPSSGHSTALRTPKSQFSGENLTPVSRSPLFLANSLCLLSDPVTGVNSIDAVETDSLLPVLPSLESNSSPPIRV